MSKQNENTLSASLESDGLVSAQLHAASVTIGEKEIQLHIAELPDGKFRKIIGKASGYDRSDLIAEAVRNEDGSFVFKKADGKLVMKKIEDGSYESVVGLLKPKVARDIEKLVMTHNGFDEEKAEAEGND